MNNIVATIYLAESYKMEREWKKYILNFKEMEQFLTDFLDNLKYG